MVMHASRCMVLKTSCQALQARVHTVVMVVVT